jgi:hypothetical protein
MSKSIRDALVEELRKVLGSGVHVIPYQDNVDALDRRTVMVKQTTISPLPEAPSGQLRVDYVLTFITPNVDPAKAERDLDQWVPQTLADLSMSWLSWSSAEKTLFDPQNLSYDVQAFVLTTTRNEE